MGRSPLVAATLALALTGAASPARAAEMPVIKIEMRDGTITPSRIEVPANIPFKLEITNSGKTPVEFESNELKREKVLAPDSSSSIVFRRLDAGEYPFFDDFHPEAKATLVAK
jgi:hypothetical protein